MDIQSILGYSQGSPFANNPYLNIQGNNITMQNTDIPLLLQPMKKGKKFGKPKMGIPFDKNPYLFPSADSVMEIPIMQKAGFFNPYGDPRDIARQNISRSDETKLFNIPVHPISSDRQVIKEAGEAKKIINTKELARRKKAISQSNSNNSFATSAAGDKLRLFPDDPNSIIDEYLNPLKMVGDMADNIGHTFTNPNAGTGEKVLSLATPLTMGAIGSLGAKTTGQFINNLFNPFAGASKVGFNAAKKEIGVAARLRAKQAAGEPLTTNYDNVIKSILDNPTELEAIRNNINLSDNDIIKLEKYLSETYDYNNLTPFQKKKLLDRETYYLKKNNVSVDQRIQNNENLLTQWENYKKDRTEYFNSPKFKERVNKQYGEMSDENFKDFKEGLLQNLEKRPYIRPDVIDENAAAHYKQEPTNKLGIDDHKYGHSYFKDKYASDPEVVFHEGRHQLTNAEDEFFFFPSRKEIQQGLVHPDLLKFDSDLTNPKTGADYFLSSQEFIARLDELKRDMSKVGYDYKTMDLTPEIIKKYRGVSPKEAIFKVTGKPSGIKLNELTPEQHDAVIQLLDEVPEKTTDSQRLLRWFKDDFLLNQINNKWALIPPAAIGVASLQNKKKGGLIKAQKGLNFEDITGINPLKNLKQNSEQQPINKVDARFVRNLIPNQYKNKDSLKEISREQFDKTASFKDIALNPMTALKYKIHGQDIPSNFIQGDRNPLDYAVDAINPFMYSNSLTNTLKNVVHPINTISTLGKASVNAATNLVDGDNAFNDGSNEKSLQMIMDAGVAGSMLNPHVNWKNIPKIIEADPLNRATFKLRTGTEHPLYKIVKERIKNNNYGEAAKYISIATANRLVPVFGKSPIVKKIAENVMNKSSSYNRDMNDIFNSTLDFLKNEGSYNGTFNRGSRNLVKNYLYGDETGFTSNNIQPIGLEKYVNRYGKLKSYDLDIPDINLPQFNEFDINKGIDSRYIYSELKRNKLFHDLPSKYSKENFNNFLKEKIVQNNGVYSLSSDQLNLYKDRFDNIAGHMNHFKLDNNGNPILHIQDLWKFTPEDYNKKWNKIFEMKNIDGKEYFNMKQPALLDKVGKPFILSKELSIFQKGGLIKAQNGLYFNNLDEYTSFQKNLKTKSKQIDGTSAIPYMRSDRTSILDEGKQLTTDNNTCIDAVTGLMIDCGSKEKTRFIGNSSFLDNYKKGNSDLQLVNGNFQIGDMVQATRSFKGKSGEPFDMKIISDINDDNITLTGTSGGNTFKNKIIKFNELKEYIKNGERNIFRPGKFARKELIQKERENQTSPEVIQALQNRKENLEFQTYIPAQANYEYSLRDDSPMYNKYKKGNMPVLNSYFNFANNEEEKNKLINKLDKLGLAKLAKREEVENSLLNVFGTMGQENKWRKAPVTGVGIGTAAENLWERIFSPKNRSIGPGQIRFSELTDEEKEQFGIKKPKDLFDTDKVISLMTYKDLQNKNYLLNQGKKLSQRISGTKGKDLEDLQRESTYYNHLSPILNRGKRVLYNDMRKFIENEENSYYRTTDEDFINKKVEEQISNREVKFSPKSYTGSVLKNWQTNLQRVLLNPSTEENPRLLPNIVIKSNKKMQDGGEIDSLLWEDYDEEQQPQEEVVVQIDNYKSIQQQAKELKSKQMEVERRLMKRQSFDDFVDFIDDPSESSNYTSRSENYQNNSSYKFKNPYITDINLPSAQVVTGDKEQRAYYAMRYLIAKGLTKEAAAGIIGNAGQESSMFHPKVLSGEILGDKNTSYGAFQWHGPRMTKALNWMKQNNKNINSIDTHLDYALEEASQMGIMNMVNSAKSPEQAANIWRDKFEKPGVKDLNRANFARQIYNKF